MSKTKQKSRYWVISILIISVLGFVLPSFWRYSASKLGNNPNYFHMGDNVVDFANLTTYSMLVFGIVGTILSYIISINIRRNLIKNTRKTYPKDIILCHFYPQVKIMLFCQFMLCGYFFGQMIFPFFLSTEITHIDMVTRQNLIPHFLYGLIGFTFGTIIEAYTVILTDKRLIGTYKWLGTAIVLLKDIKDIKKNFWGYEIIAKTGSVFPLKFTHKAEKCGKMIEKLIKKGYGT